jgi:hypothetical protein
MLGGTDPTAPDSPPSRSSEGLQVLLPSDNPSGFQYSVSGSLPDLRTRCWRKTTGVVWSFALLGCDHRLGGVVMPRTSSLIKETTGATRDIEKFAAWDRTLTARAG